MLSGKLLPAHPHPLPNELLSSWLTRLAQANGIKLHSLALDLWDRKTALAAWARDIDRSISNQQLLKITERTGVSENAIRDTTLASFEGTLTETIYKNTHDPFILPCGIKHRTKTKNWLVYCPKCLAEDKVPYYRLTWRLAIFTVCPKHKTAMLDQCPICKAPINFVRGELGQRFVTFFDSLCNCVNCGFNLTFAKTYQPEFPNHKVQINYLSLLNQLKYKSLSYESLHFKNGYELFIFIIHLSCFLQSKRGNELLKRSQLITKPTNQMVFSNPTKNTFSEINLNDRHELLMLSLWLLNDWPKRFECLYKKSKISRTKFLGDGNLPVWIDSFLKRIDN